MTKKPRHWHPALDPEDIELWEVVKKSVKPLSKIKKQQEDKAEIKEPLKKLKPLKNEPQKAAPIPLKLAKPHTKPALPSEGFDRQTKRKIKSGRVEIEDVLDLHGLTQAAAHRALSHFLSVAQQQQLRLVLVITGKGKNASDGEGGILQRAVPLWLKDEKHSGVIIGFSKAENRHGGSGALYVRLKRLK